MWQRNDVDELCSRIMFCPATVLTVLLCNSRGILQRRCGSSGQCSRLQLDRARRGEALLVACCMAKAALPVNSRRTPSAHNAQGPHCTSKCFVILIILQVSIVTRGHRRRARTAISHISGFPAGRELYYPPYWERWLRPRSALSAAAPRRPRAGRGWRESREIIHKNLILKRK